MKTTNGIEVKVVKVGCDKVPDVVLESMLPSLCDLDHYTKLGYQVEEQVLEVSFKHHPPTMTMGKDSIEAGFELVSPDSRASIRFSGPHSSGWVWVHTAPDMRCTKQYWEAWRADEVMWKEEDRKKKEDEDIQRRACEEKGRWVLWSMYQEGKLFTNEGGIKPVKL